MTPAPCRPSGASWGPVGVSGGRSIDLPPPGAFRGHLPRLAAFSRASGIVPGSSLWRISTQDCVRATSQIRFCIPFIKKLLEFSCRGPTRLVGCSGKPAPPAALWRGPHAAGGRATGRLSGLSSSSPFPNPFLYLSLMGKYLEMPLNLPNLPKPSVPRTRGPLGYRALS